MKKVLNRYILVIFLFSLLSCSDNDIILNKQSWKVHYIENVDVYIKNNTGEWVIHECPAKVILNVVKIYNVLPELNDTTYISYSDYNNYFKLIHKIIFLSHELNLNNDTTNIITTTYKKI